MRITIDDNIIETYDISFGDFLVLLMLYYGQDYNMHLNYLITSGIISTDKFNPKGIIMSDKAKRIVAEILVQSSEKLKDNPVDDYYGLAKKLQEIYPDGCKDGTSYKWRSDYKDVAFNLMLLVTTYDFHYTEEEAIEATKQYVESFKDAEGKYDFTHMQLLKYFILKITKDKDLSSVFMSTIENNKDESK